jgi:hypothetical protein
MEITTHSVEHFLLSMYAVFLIVDLAVAYRDKVRFKIKYNIVKSYFDLFCKTHVWTLLTVIAFYVIYSFFF